MLHCRAFHYITSHPSFITYFPFFLFTFFDPITSASQVNIAQFHPIPGNGIVYGTKRGKVKVFYRNKYEPKTPVEDEIVMGDN